MSYDIYYHVPSGYPADVNCDLSPTYNVAGIFRASLTAAGLTFQEGGNSISALHGLTGEQAAPALVKALAWVRDPANDEAITKMEPSNGWGNRRTVEHVYSVLLECCQRAPDGVIDTKYGDDLPEWVGGGR